ncbi:hypothetical protein PUR71_37150 [Streptomyces sp. SP17BM10]|uniref:WXG100-like domain-containing protein n=1 Tax=Streptomyces sp. SP17BM10 TaxID=3002530 RepID=UPI002E75EFBF|nr:hypothetical protein [Streptomyces sp. SP17BM10]MEE1788488.1 hypothetical protein [Streptomyces sp. SP17BM10]
MSIEIPDGLAKLFHGLTGMAWPEANEDDLRKAGDYYLLVAKNMPQLEDYVRQAAAYCTANIAGQAGTELAATAGALVGAGGKDNALDLAGKQCAQLGQVAHDTANQVEYAKWMTIAQLIQLALEIAWAIAASPFTGGASLGTIVAARAVAEGVIRKILAWLIDRILMHTVVSIAGGLVMDTIIQLIQIGRGDKSEWDSKSTLQAVEFGALNGVVGGPLALLGGGLTKLFRGVIGKSLGKEAGRVLGGDLAKVSNGLAKDGLNGVLSKDAVRTLGETAAKDLATGAERTLANEARRTAAEAAARDAARSAENALAGEAAHAAAGAAARDGGKWLARESAEAFGNDLARTIGRYSHEIGNAFTGGLRELGKDAVARFEKDVAQVFEQHFGSVLGREEAAQLGKDFAHAMAVSGGRGAAEHEALRTAMRDALGSRGLSSEGIAHLAEQVPGLLDKVGGNTRLFRVGIAVGGYLGAGVQNGLTEGFYNLTFGPDHSFSVTWETFVSGMAMGFIGHMGHKGAAPLLEHYGKWVSKKLADPNDTGPEVRYLPWNHPLTILSAVANLTGRSAPFPVPRPKPMPVKVEHSGESAHTEVPKAGSTSTVGGRTTTSSSDSSSSSSSASERAPIAPAPDSVKVQGGTEHQQPSESEVGGQQGAVRTSSEGGTAPSAPPSSEPEAPAHVATSESGPEEVAPPVRVATSGSTVPEVPKELPDLPKPLPEVPKPLPDLPKNNRETDVPVAPVAEGTPTVGHLSDVLGHVSQDGTRYSVPVDVGENGRPVLDGKEILPEEMADLLRRREAAGEWEPSAQTVEFIGAGGRRAVDPQYVQRVVDELGRSPRFADVQARTGGTGTAFRTAESGERARAFDESSSDRRTFGDLLRTSSDGATGPSAHDRTGSEDGTRPPAPRMRPDRTPRFVVRSGFDARRFEHDGPVTDLTVRVAFRDGGAGHDAGPVWEKVVRGVEEHLNAPRYRLANGDRMHVTVLRAEPGEQAHLTVDLVGRERGMDQHSWWPDADPVDYAHELGHQLGLRDEYREADLPHRPAVAGSLAGDYRAPAPDGLRGAGLRGRHLDLISSVVGHLDPPVGGGARHSWDQARAAAPAHARSHVWVDPVSAPRGPVRPHTSGGPGGTEVSPRTHGGDGVSDGQQPIHPGGNEAPAGGDTSNNSIIMHPSYASGDQFGVAVSMLHDRNLHVVIARGPEEGRPGHDPVNDRSREIAQFYLDSGISADRIHVVDVPSVEKKGQWKALNREAERIAREDWGIAKSFDEMYQVKEIWGVTDGTDYVARTFSKDLRNQVRDAWGMSDEHDGRIHEWLEGRGIHLPEDRKGKVLVLWSRFTGKRTHWSDLRARMEHDTSFEGTRQILREVARDYDAVIVTGDPHPRRGGKWDALVAEMREELGVDTIHNVTGFWRDAGPEVTDWTGRTRTGQLRLYDYLHRKHKLDHLGARSGNLEASALIGHRVSYLEEEGASGSKRMEQWHDVGGGRTRLGGLAPRYERAIIAEPPTASGRYAKPYDNARPDRTGANHYDAPERTAWWRKPIDVYGKERGFDYMSLSSIRNRLNLPARRSVDYQTFLQHRAEHLQRRYDRLRREVEPYLAGTEEETAYLAGFDAYLRAAAPPPGHESLYQWYSSELLPHLPGLWAYCRSRYNASSLYSWGYEVVAEVPRDGDCLYHSVDVLLGRTEGAQALRNEVVGWMDRNRQAVAQYAAEFSTPQFPVTFRGLREVIATQGQWAGTAGDLVPRIVASALRTRLHIFDGETQHSVEPLGGVVDRELHVFLNERHYTPLRPVGSAADDGALKRTHDARDSDGEGDEGAGQQDPVGKKQRPTAAPPSGDAAAERQQPPAAPGGAARTTGPVHERVAALDHLDAGTRRRLAGDAAFVSGLRSELGAADFARATARLVVDVDPRTHQPVAARREAEAQVARMLHDPEVAARLLREGVRVVVVPRDVPMTHVQGMEGLRGRKAGGDAGDGRSWDTIRGASWEKVVAITEENLLGARTTVKPADGSATAHPDGYSTATHEIAHAIHEFGLTEREKQLIGDVYSGKRQADGLTDLFAEEPVTAWPDGGRRNTRGDLVGNYSSADEHEFFAQLTNAYLGANHGYDPGTGLPRNNGADWVRANEPELLPLLERLYGPDPRTTHPEPANPVGRTDAEEALFDGYREFMHLATGEPHPVPAEPHAVAGRTDHPPAEADVIESALNPAAGHDGSPAPDGEQPPSAPSDDQLIRPLVNSILPSPHDGMTFAIGHLRLQGKDKAGNPYEYAWTSDRANNGAKQFPGINTRAELQNLKTQFWPAEEKAIKAGKGYRSAEKWRADRVAELLGGAASKHAAASAELGSAATEYKAALDALKTWVTTRGSGTEAEVRRVAAAKEAAEAQRASSMKKVTDAMATAEAARAQTWQDEGASGGTRGFWDAIERVNRSHAEAMDAHREVERIQQALKDAEDRGDNERVNALAKEAFVLHREADTKVGAYARAERAVAEELRKPPADHTFGYQRKDAEVSLLNAAYGQLERWGFKEKNAVSGVFVVFSTKGTCESCKFVVRELNEAYPGIRVVAAYPKDIGKAVPTRELAFNGAKFDVEIPYGYEHVDGTFDVAITDPQGRKRQHRIAYKTVAPTVRPNDPAPAGAAPHGTAPAEHREATPPANDPSAPHAAPESARREQPSPATAHPVDRPGGADGPFWPSSEPPDPATAAALALFPHRSDVRLVALHTSGGQLPLSPRELADRLIEWHGSGGWDGRTALRLVACDLASRGGHTQVAEVLAHLAEHGLTPEVHAATGPVWFAPDHGNPGGEGHLLVAERVGFDAHGRPTVAAGGHWESHRLGEDGSVVRTELPAEPLPHGYHAAQDAVGALDHHLRSDDRAVRFGGPSGQESRSPGPPPERPATRLETGDPVEVPRDGFCLLAAVARSDSRVPAGLDPRHRTDSAPAHEVLRRAIEQYLDDHRDEPLPEGIAENYTRVPGRLREAGPLTPEERGALRSAVANWDRDWASDEGEMFPPLVAHALGIRLRIVASSTRQIVAEYGEPAHPQVTVFLHGSHYEASDLMDRPQRRRQQVQALIRQHGAAIPLPPARDGAPGAHQPAEIAPLVFDLGTGRPALDAVETRMGRTGLPDPGVVVLTDPGEEPRALTVRRSSDGALVWTDAASGTVLTAGPDGITGATHVWAALPGDHLSGPDLTAHLDGARTYVIRAENSGDMYHMRGAMITKKDFSLLIWNVGHGTRGQAEQIVNLHDDLIRNGRRVVYTTDRELPRGFGGRGETQATEDIKAHLFNGAVHKEIKQLERPSQPLDDKQTRRLAELLQLRATTDPRDLRNVARETFYIPEFAAEYGRYTPEEAVAFAEDLRTLGGFGPDGNRRYVIVPYRASGHSNRAGANAPALDTGTHGLEQIIAQVRQNLPGVDVVPMGEKPDGWGGPQLRNYWDWPSVGNRRKELSLLRYLADQHVVVGAVGMRSGVMDELAFAGMRIISIDISPHRGLTRGALEFKPSKGWTRGLKLEEAFGRSYGRVFLEHARDDDLTKRIEDWQGRFAPDDLAEIAHSLTYYFGEAAGLADDGERAALVPQRHRSHPLSGIRTERLLEELDKLGVDGATGFELVHRIGPYLNEAVRHSKLVTGGAADAGTLWKGATDDIHRALGRRIAELRAAAREQTTTAYAPGVEWMAEHVMRDLIEGNTQYEFYRDQVELVRRQALTEYVEADPARRELRAAVLASEAAVRTATAQYDTALAAGQDVVVLQNSVWRAEERLAEDRAAFDAATAGWEQQVWPGTDGDPAAVAAWYRNIWEFYGGAAWGTEPEPADD